MLTISGLSKAYADHVLLREVDLQINEGDRIALVGPNGAGKTTLFSIIQGLIEPDAGLVTLQKRRTVGYLPQECQIQTDQSVLHVALHGPARAQPPTDTAPVSEDGQREAKAKRILAGLGFAPTDFGRPVQTMSGGWMMRAYLASLLLHEPDLLLMDEPTNHLDLHSVLWLQQYLMTYPGALLFISHDRAFLNSLALWTLELSHGSLTRYRGDYDAYQRQKAEAAQQQEAAYQSQQREIQRLTRFVERFGAKSSKASQAQSKLKQLARIERIEAPVESRRALRFQFKQPPRSGQEVIRLEQIHHAYKDLVVYRGIDFRAERGQRIALVGPNGAGKSTLMKLLAGRLPVQAGTRQLGYHVEAGYFSQHRTEVLDPRRTLLEEALDTPHPITEEYARTILGSFMFGGDDVFKQIKVLSGGEKSRMSLVKLLLNPPNLLLMDEPTTHLDMMGIDALIQALNQFEGTLIFISHDVHFIRSLAQQVLHVEHGRLQLYYGGYDYYLEKHVQTETSPGGQHLATQVSNSTSEDRALSRKEIRRREAEERQHLSKQRRVLEKKVHDVETAITTLETRQHICTEALEQPATYQDAEQVRTLTQELKEIATELERLNTAWEESQSALEDFEQQHTQASAS